MADSPTSDPSVNITPQDPASVNITPQDPASQDPASQDPASVNITPQDPTQKQHFTVGVIGKILSHLGSTRDAVIASATCKAFRNAWCNYLHTFSFNSREWPLLDELNSDNLQTLITQTIFQNTALHCLTISVGDEHQFIAENVNAWLYHTENCLRVFHYNVSTTPDFNFIGICGKQRLEVLNLVHNSIKDVMPNIHKFPCLMSLSLSYVTISALDLSLLISICPQLETLTLVSPEPAMTDNEASLRLKSSSLKNFYGKSFKLDRFTLEMDLIENIDMKHFRCRFFGLIGKGTLRQLKINDGNIEHFDIRRGSIENLEIIDCMNFTTRWRELYSVMSRASKLHKLRLWIVDFNDGDQVVNVEQLAVCFPQLKYLSLFYDLSPEVVSYGLQDLTIVMNVVELEIGWTTIHHLDFFFIWVDGLLEACLNLEKLFIAGHVPYNPPPPISAKVERFHRYLNEVEAIYKHLEIDFDCS